MLLFLLGSRMCLVQQKTIIRRVVDLGIKRLFGEIAIMKKKCHKILL